MIVKVFITPNPGVAILTTKDCNVRHALVLDDTLRNKMCRRDRAYFEAASTDDGNVALYKRVSDQKW